LMGKRPQSIWGNTPSTTTRRWSSESRIPIPNP
jgi:hypothetical protein